MRSRRHPRRRAPAIRRRSTLRRPPSPQEVLAPKERRARKRAAKAPAPSGPKTAEERNAERLAARAHKAKLRRNYRQRAKTKAAEARKDQPAAEPHVAPEHGPGRAKVRQGFVVSDKADKTIIVRVDVTRRHRRYGKIMRTSTEAARPRRAQRRGHGRHRARGRVPPDVAHQALAPHRRPREGQVVIQNETRLKVADNTGRARSSASA
jgi:hypothetical protein